jgi:Uma2 family endonuclease
MAETPWHRRQMNNLIFNLDNLTAEHPRVYVGGNMLMYYNPRSGWDHVSPDVFVTFDVSRGERGKWETWKEGGRFADVVFEITSKSTYAEDLGKKRRLYARLGVRELYLYDPEHDVQPYFRGFRLVNGELVELPPPVNNAYYSPLLGAELRVIGPWLRVIGPATGEPLPIPEEIEAARYLAEEQKRLAEEREHQAVEREHQAVERERQAEEQRQREAAARQAAETALRQALAELARLRGEESAGS